jgi:hypothetical protein
MATTVSSSRIWNGLKVDETTDLYSGKIQLTSGSSDVLASSSDFNWKVDDLERFTRLYNNRAKGIPQLTTTAFEKTFYNSATKLFNEDRAAVLNTTSNYASVKDAQNLQAYFVDTQKVPGLQHPITGQVVNQDGSVTSGNPFGSPAAFLKDGVPNTGFYSDPNIGLEIKSLDQSPPTSSLPSATALRYPLNDVSQFGLDYIEITAHKYSASKTIQGGRGGNSILGGTKDSRMSGKFRLGDKLGTVQLPMQKKIQEMNGIDWGSDQLTFLEAAMSDMALGGIQALGKDFSLEGGLQSAKTMASSAVQSVQDFATDSASQYFIAAYFAGQAVGTNITARASGTVVNPNMELLFKGPNLRSFNFSFVLSPRDEAEANRVKQIIKFFKKSIHPRVSNNGLYLFTPDIFTLKYVYNGSGQHPFLHKFKPCACKGFSVDYNPTGNYMTYSDGSMPTYALNMQFEEIAPLYAEDFDTDSNDMGF